MKDKSVCEVDNERERNGADCGLPKGRTFAPYREAEWNQNVELDYQKQKIEVEIALSYQNAPYHEPEVIALCRDEARIEDIPYKIGR